MFHRWLLFAGAAVFAIGCSHGSSTAPDALSTGKPLVLADLMTGQPVSGSATPGVGGALTASITGYVSPSVFVPTRENIQYLIPDTADMPYAGYTDIALYGDGEKQGSPNPLMRPTALTITLVPGPRFRADPRAMSALEEAVSYHNQINGEIQVPGSRYIPTILLADPGQSGPFPVPIELNPADPAFQGILLQLRGALTVLTFDSSSRVIQAHISFASLDGFWGRHLFRACAHETAHVRGFAGHPPGGIMGSGNEADDTFTSREKRVFSILSVRYPGTRARDDSSVATVTASARQKPSQRIVCILPRP